MGETVSILGNMARVAANPWQLVHRYMTGPDCVQMFVSTACNARCAHCCFGDMLHKPELMPLDMALDALDQMRKWHPVVKLIGGEPLTHPDLGTICGKASRLRMAPNITTNGISLEQRAAEIVASGCAVLNVSIDGHDEDTYFARNRVAGTYEKMVLGVFEVQRLRRALPVIIAHTMVNDDLPAVCGHVNALRIDEWHVFPKYFYTDRVRENCQKKGASFPTGAWTDRPLMTLEQWHRIRDYILYCQHKSMVPVHVNPQCFDYLHSQLVPPKIVDCMRWRELNVMPNGDVGICNGSVLLGNLKTDTLDQIWMNGRHMDFIEHFGNGYCDSMCYRCCGANIVEYGATE